MSRKKSTSDKTKIEDVATAAGVSIMTVSRALRGVEGVSEQRRQEIVEIARRLRYVPNSNARSLVGDQSALIGISLPTLFNDVFADILEGMRGAFDAAGFATVVNTTEYQREREKDWVNRVLTWRPSAMVLTGADHDPAVVEILRESRVPVLEVWDFSAEPIDICVGIDHEKAGYQIASKLRGRGYRRPAFVGFASGHDPRAERRLSGVQRAFADNAAYEVRVARPKADSPYQVGYEGLKQLWLDGVEKPDIIFFLSDHLAFGAMMACEELEISTPDDVGLVGFNGLPITTVLPKKLTTVITPRRRMGTLGASCLIARINGVRSDLSSELETEIVLGGTTR